MFFLLTQAAVRRVRVQFLNVLARFHGNVDADLAYESAILSRVMMQSAHIKVDVVTRFTRSTQAQCSRRQFIEDHLNCSMDLLHDEWCLGEARHIKLLGRCRGAIHLAALWLGSEENARHKPERFRGSLNKKCETLALAPPSICMTLNLFFLFTFFSISSILFVLKLLGTISQVPNWLEPQQRPLPMM